MTCLDCIHLKPCINSIFNKKCEDFADRSRFVELPCKVGDDVYCMYHGKIERSGVTSICIGSHYTDIVIYTVQFSFTAEDIGKFIFFSVEEAEQALKE